jgi:hypothetical protein
MKNNGVKLGIIFTCLIVAGFLFYRNFSNAEDPQPEMTNLPQWICTKCGHTFQLPVDKLQNVQSREEPIPGSAEKEGIRAAPRKHTYIQCDSCKELEAVGAIKCDKHGATYRAVLPDGTRNKCEKCAEEASTTE